MRNNSLNPIIQSFKCFLFESNNITDKEIIEIKKNKNESKIIIIDRIFKLNEQYVIVFDQTIIFSSDSNISFLLESINYSKESKIFISQHEIKNVLNTDYNFFENDDNEYLMTINSFSNNFQIMIPNEIEIKIVWSLIANSFSSFFINKSYSKLEINFGNINNNRTIELNNQNYIMLQNLCHGSSSSIELIYQLDLGELFVIKKFINKDNDKLFQREYKNYLNIQPNLIPHFYGKTKINNYQCLIIQYIRGKSLRDIDKIKLLEKDKLNIILQIITIIQYLQSKNFIYRDLQPKNIIIDINKNANLIDFDRMVNRNEEKIDTDITKYFTNDFICPEIKYGYITNYTKKEDVYSLGILIYFILFNELPKIKYVDQAHNIFYSFDKLGQKYPQIQVLCEECTQMEPNKRPSITSIANYFFNNVLVQYSTDIKTSLGMIYYAKQDINKSIQYLTQSSQLNDPRAQYNLGIIYYDGKYVKQDINKAIQYFILSANQNYADSQYYLGLIYIEGIYVKQDIKKAIYYFTLASKQNHVDAINYISFLYYEGKYIKQDINKTIHYLKLLANQYKSKEHSRSALFMLGIIYFDGKYIKRDISKSIYYLSLAADQNDIKAQLCLGVFYMEGRDIRQDISKAIYYLTLSANQNNSDAQLKLGLIYSQGKLVQRDINKAIYYYTLSANQNNKYAQCNLGDIYLDNKYIQQDIKKAIYYLTLAASQNSSEAQIILGLIYYKGEYIKKDINKTIYYFKLLADKNDPMAQFHLGLIYYEGDNVLRDINKSLHYFTLSANQNNQMAQCYLGLFFYEGIYVKRNIDKSLHYFTLSANQNDQNAQYCLGYIFYEGIYVKRNIDKSLHYLTLSANQNDKQSQFLLGYILYEHNYDINKAIYYFTLSAFNGFHKAQYFLGYIYYRGKFVKRDVKKGISYLLESSKSHIDANYMIGYFYHKGKYLKNDIHKSIQHYKEASSFNHIYAKNNLGVIYKNGFSNEISANIGYAIVYFKEAILQKKDVLSIYNLSNIYIYNMPNDEYLNEAIKLLVSNIELDPNFSYSYNLLLIAIFRKHKKKINIIMNEIKNIFKDSIEKYSILYEIITINELYNNEKFEIFYEQYKTIDFIYDYKKKIINIRKLTNWKTKSNIKTTPNITADFYEGFGI